MFQIVNGIPRPVQKPLEKVDFLKVREIHENDPVQKLIRAGMTQKEALIAVLQNM